MNCALNACVLLWDTHSSSIFHAPHVHAQATFKELSVYSLGLVLQQLRSCQQAWAKVVMAKEVGQDLMTIGIAGEIGTINGGIIRITTQVVVLAVWQGTFRTCWEKLLRLAR